MRGMMEAYYSTEKMAYCQYYKPIKPIVMFTKNGKQVKNLVFVKELGLQVGNVDGKVFTWDKDGRRNKVYKSGLDLNLTKVMFANAYTFGGKLKMDSTLYPTQQEAVDNAMRGYLKTVKVEL
jgi:hypothetical protein